MLRQVKDIPKPETDHFAFRPHQQHQIPLDVRLLDLDEGDGSPGYHLPLLDVKDVENVAGVVEGDGETVAVGVERSEGVVSSV